MTALTVTLDERTASDRVRREGQRRPALKVHADDAQFIGDYTGSSVSPTGLTRGADRSILRPMSSVAPLLTVRVLEEAINGLPAEQRAQWRWAPTALAAIFSRIQEPGWSEETLQRVTHDLFGFFLEVDLSTIWPHRGQAAAEFVESITLRLREVPARPLVRAVGEWVVEAVRTLAGSVADHSTLDILGALDPADLRSLQENRFAQGYAAACAAWDVLDRDDPDHAGPLFVTAFKRMLAAWPVTFALPFADEPHASTCKRMLGYVQVARSVNAVEDIDAILALAGAQLTLTRPHLSIFGILIWPPQPLPAPLREHHLAQIATLSRDDGARLGSMIALAHQDVLLSPRDLELAAKHVRFLQLGGQAEAAELAAIRILAFEAHSTTPAGLTVAEVLCDAGLIEDAKRVLESLRELPENERKRARQIAVRLGVRFGLLEWLASYSPTAEGTSLAAEVSAWRRRQTVLEVVLAGKIASFDVELLREDGAPRLVLTYYTSVTSWTELEYLHSSVWDELERLGAWPDISLDITGPYIPLEGMTP